ncbi:MAG: GyrI-like domain-containing protein [Bacteroidota bacterium]
MDKLIKDGFKVIGLKTRTTNENAQAATDIPGLWNKFMTEHIMEQIPNKLHTAVLCLYTNYESDHTKPYDTILGCVVSSLDEVPDGLVGQEFAAGNYTKFTTKGNLAEGLVYNTWLDIWKKDLDRTYTVDFEVYGDKAQDPSNAEVDIYIAIR